MPVQMSQFIIFTILSRMIVWLSIINCSIEVLAKILNNVNIFSDINCQMPLFQWSTRNQHCSILFYLNCFEVVDKWRSQFASLQKREKFRSHVLYVFIESISKQVYTALKAVIANFLLVIDTIDLVVSNTSKLFGRFQMHGNRVVKICMLCKIDK